MLFTGLHIQHASALNKIYDDDDQQTIIKQETQVQDKKPNCFKPRIDTHKGI